MSARSDQIKALGNALAAMMPQCSPVSLQWATRLYDEHNVRVELADAPGPASAAPAQPVDTHAWLLSALRIQDPALAERIDAAQTDEQRAALAAELKAAIPPEVWAAVTKQFEASRDVTE